jgi:hypothetical protein
MPCYSAAVPCFDRAYRPRAGDSVRETPRGPQPAASAAAAGIGRIPRESSTSVVDTPNGPREPVSAAVGTPRPYSSDQFTRDAARYGWIR